MNRRERISYKKKNIHHNKYRMRRERIDISYDDRRKIYIDVSYDDISKVYTCHIENDENDDRRV